MSSPASERYGNRTYRTRKKSSRRTDSTVSSPQHTSTLGSARLTGKEIRARTSSRLWSMLRRWDWDGVTPCGRHGDGLISFKNLHRKMVKQPRGMCPMKREPRQPCVLSEMMDMHKAGSTATWIKKSTVATRTIKEECRSTAKRWHQDWLANPTAPDPDPEESADQSADDRATEFARGEAGPSTRFSSRTPFEDQMDEATRNAVNSALEEEGQSLGQNYQRHIMEAIVQGQQAVNQVSEIRMWACRLRSTDVRTEARVGPIPRQRQRASCPGATRTSRSFVCSPARAALCVLSGTWFEPRSRCPPRPRQIFLGQGSMSNCGAAVPAPCAFRSTPHTSWR